MFLGKVGRNRLILNLYRVLFYLLPGLYAFFQYGSTRLKAEKGDDYTSYRSKLIFYSIVFVLWIFLGPFHPLKLHNIYVPRIWRGCRKRVKKHKLTLVDVLKSLSKKVPAVESLARIEERARRNVNSIREIVEERISSRVGVLLTGSTAERFNVPLSPCWVSHNVKPILRHALCTDFDYMIIPSDAEVSTLPSNARYYIDIHDVNLKRGFVHVINKETKSKCSAKTILKDIQDAVLSLRLSDFYEYGPAKNVCKYCIQAKSHFCSVSIQGASHTLKLRQHC